MWNDVVKAAITLLAALLSVVTPYLVLLIRKHLTVGEVAKLQEFAHVAVAAVEQLDKNQGLSNQQKFDAAGTFLFHLADRAGISLTKVEVQPLVEAAVHAIGSVGAVLVSTGGEPLSTDSAPLPAVPVAGPSTAEIAARIASAIQVSLGKIVDDITETAKSPDRLPRPDDPR